MGASDPKTAFTRTYFRNQPLVIASVGVAGPPERSRRQKIPVAHRRGNKSRFIAVLQSCPCRGLGTW